MNDLDFLLPAIAAGDPDAFGHWVARCELRLRGSLRSFASQVDVEAVLQETLLRVWQVADRVEPDGKPDCLLRFAIRVGRNVAISELRRLGRPTAELEAAERFSREPTEAASEPDPLLRRLIGACREKLPRKPSQALDQRLQSGGTEPDRVLAARLGMRLNTFVQNVTRARKLLAQCLERGGVVLEGLLP